MSKLTEDMSEHDYNEQSNKTTRRIEVIRALLANINKIACVAICLIK